jgi:hypothetical protein
MPPAPSVAQGSRITQHKQMELAHRLRYPNSTFRTKSASIVHSYRKMCFYPVLFQKQTYCNGTYHKVMKAANVYKAHVDLLRLQNTEWTTEIRFLTTEWIFIFSDSPGLFWSPSSLLPNRLPGTFPRNRVKRA